MGRMVFRSSLCAIVYWAEPTILSGPTIIFGPNTAIKKQDYQRATPIQCSALPIVLSGRDIIGIAKTGSGETAAFVLPMIVHIMDQPVLQKEEGPIGVICASTREMAHQIYLRVQKICEITWDTCFCCIWISQYIKSIKSVVNFDIAKDMDMHVHRIGRTGRAGDKDGTAYTLITQKEARFAGELVNSLVAAGQIVSTELMDLAMKDGRFRSKRDSRKGGGKKGRGRGGGGRGVRGVDFGLGIGYNTESNSSSSNTVPSRSAAVTPQRTGMMSQFKTKFVAASSNSPSQGSGNNSSVPNRPALRGFVSGGSIGGDVYRTQTASTITPASPTSVVNKTAAQNTGANTSQKASESSRDKPRERRRRSGWDC